MRNICVDWLSTVPHSRPATNETRTMPMRRSRELDAWDEMVDLASYVGDRRLMAEAARRIHDQSVESGTPLSRAITASVMALDIDNAVKRARQQLAMRPGQALIQYQAHRALLW